MPTSVYVSSPRFPLTGVQRSRPNSRTQAHVGPNGMLALHDLARHRFGEPFDAGRLRRARSTSSIASSSISEKRDI